jgi:hypothetical protein
MSAWGSNLRPLEQKWRVQITRIRISLCCIRVFYFFVNWTVMIFLKQTWKNMWLYNTFWLHNHLKKDWNDLNKVILYIFHN